MHACECGYIFMHVMCTCTCTCIRKPFMGTCYDDDVHVHARVSASKLCMGVYVVER